MSNDQWMNLPVSTRLLALMAIPQYWLFAPLMTFVVISRRIYFATIFRLENALLRMRQRLIQRAADSIEAKRGADDA